MTTLIARFGLAVTLAVVGATLAGCGDSVPKSYPVAGRVEVAGGDPGLLVS